MTAAIAGIGQTEFSKDSGRSELQLAVEAVHAALLDAGLQPSDVDGMVTFQQDANDELDIARSLGIPEIRWTARTPFGGGGASATIQLAAAAVDAGMADCVVIYRAFNERSGRRFGQPLPVSTAPVNMSPYLPLTFAGSVQSVDASTGRVVVAVQASNELGPHLTGTVELELAP